MVRHPETLARQQQILGHRPVEHQQRHPHPGYFHPPASHTQPPPPLVRSHHPSHPSLGVKSERASPHPTPSPPALSSIPRGVDVARTSQAPAYRPAPGLLPASSSGAVRPPLVSPRVVPQPSPPASLSPGRSIQRAPSASLPQGVQIQRANVSKRPHPQLPPGINVQRTSGFQQVPGTQTSSSPGVSRPAAPLGVSMSRQQFSQPPAAPQQRPQLQPAPASISRLEQLNLSITTPPARPQTQSNQSTLLLMQ